jgi:hypothetical protein
VSSRYPLTLLEELCRRVIFLASFSVKKKINRAISFPFFLCFQLNLDLNDCGSSEKNTRMDQLIQQTRAIAIPKFTISHQKIGEDAINNYVIAEQSK